MTDQTALPSAFKPDASQNRGSLAKRFKRTVLKPIYYGVMRMLPERLAISLDYAFHLRTLPSLKNPRTFNEKIQWRKLYERDPRFTDLVDKSKAKRIMAEKFGSDFIIQSLFEGEDPEQVPFAHLKPPYIIKVTHSSHMNIFVLDDKYDAEAIKKRLRDWLAFDHSRFAREWAYADVPRRIIIEPIIGDGKSRLTDYRFHVFDGNVFCIEVDAAGSTGYRTNLYSPAWEKLPVEYGPFPNSEESIAKPEKFNEMMKYASVLGRGISYVRVDLYNVDGKPLFGELTFYPCAGCGRFKPKHWDLLMGEQWQLPPPTVLASHVLRTGPRVAKQT